MILTPPRLLLASILVLMLLAGLAAERADANPYQVVECHQGENPAAPDARSDRSSGHFTLGVQCGLGTRGLTINAAGQPPNGYLAYWEFVAPPGTIFTQVDSTLGLAWANGIGPWVQLWHPGTGTATHGFSSQGWQGDSATNTTLYRVLLGCQSNSCGPGTDPHVYMSYLYFTIDDPSAPSLATGGSLLSGGVKRGSETLDLSSADPSGAGFSYWRVYVNSALSQQVDACIPGRTISGRLTQFQPCGSSYSRSVAIDTQAAPWTNGPNDVRICAYDVAGNQSGCAQKTVDVDNTCAASGGSEATSLDAGIERGGDLHASLPVRSNEGPVIRGTLVSAQGNPVAGASVCVFQKIDLPDASTELVAVPSTQKNGRFTTALEPGPSREITVAYRFNNHTLEKTLRLNSTVVPVLKATDRSVHNGGNARFRGEIPGPNAASRNVALQARVGHRWRTFKIVPTDRDGHFRGLYRFTATTITTRYTFRALVKRQGGYPYEPGPSHRQRILVRG
jgi:hypothetical protein